MLLNIYFYFFVNIRRYHEYSYILKNYAGIRITDTRQIWVWMDIYLINKVREATTCVI